MEVRWIDPLQPAARDLAGAVAVLEAARLVDAPHRTPTTTASLVGRMRHGWDGDPERVAVVGDGGDGGDVAAVLEVDAPWWDNLHVAAVDVTVDPVRRRRGLGSAVFELGVEEVRALGRRTVLAQSLDQPAGTGFAKSVGLDRASEDVARRHDLLALDLDALEPLRREAEQHATAYRLERLPGWTPDAQLAEMARLTEAINDAPIDDLDLEDEVYTPVRVRAFELAQLGFGHRTYRLVAREVASGRLAGHTFVAVDSEQPGVGSQYDTSVLREHRGHRLGLLLKLGMLSWLAEAEPQLRSLDTWNAASNRHMIAINELLGYRVLARGIEWQRHL